MWNFGREKGKINIDTYKDIYESRGGKVLFVELMASLGVRVKRADSPERRRLKAHAPDPERVAYLETALDFVSPKPFYYPEAYERIDTEGKTPEQVAQEVVALL